MPCINFSFCSDIPVILLLILVADLCILSILYCTLSALGASDFCYQYTLYSLAYDRCNGFLYCRKACCGWSALNRLVTVIYLSPRSTRIPVTSDFCFLGPIIATAHLCFFIISLVLFPSLSHG